MLLLGNRLDLYNDPTYSGSLQRHKSATDPEGDELGASAPFVTRAGAYPVPLAKPCAWLIKSPSARLFRIVPLPATKDHLEAFNDLALEWPTLDRIDAESACGALNKDCVEHLHVRPDHSVDLEALSS